MLVVVSKLKKLIKEKEAFQTSGDVPEVLSAHLHTIARYACSFARGDGRKTVMGRDVQKAITHFKENKEI